MKCSSISSNPTGPPPERNESHIERFTTMRAKRATSSFHLRPLISRNFSTMKQSNGSMLEMNLDSFSAFDMLKYGMSMWYLRLTGRSTQALNTKSPWERANESLNSRSTGNSSRPSHPTSLSNGKRLHGGLDN